MMLIAGATWAKLLQPECGTTLNSARFILFTDSNTGLRILEGNSCPGYNWKSMHTKVTAGQYDYKYEVSTNPKISNEPTYVDSARPIRGTIGIALNGVPIHAARSSSKSDAAIHEARHADHCGGFNSPSEGFAFDAPITGHYHYISMPGFRRTSPTSLGSEGGYCDAVQAWYNESYTSHSPIVGIMADGIPIFGPYTSNNTYPSDLDVCGGHISDLPFYHYHFRYEYPYSVSCLRGCADGIMNSALDSGDCDVNQTLSDESDYSGLEDLIAVYGDEGENFTDWAGPGSLLAFGFVLFLISSLCCVCMCCTNKLSDETRMQLSLDEGYVYDMNGEDYML
jgi:hypothetical protein